MLVAGIDPNVLFGIGSFVVAVTTAAVALYKIRPETRAMEVDTVLKVNAELRVRVEELEAELSLERQEKNALQREVRDLAVRVWTLERRLGERGPTPPSQTGP